MKISIKKITYISTVSIVLALIYNTFSSDGIPLIRKPLVVKMVDDLGQPYDNSVVNGLKLADVISLYRNKSTIFIDARDQWDYSEGHIKGAINIPEFSFEPNDSQLERLNKNDLLVIYCDGDDCDTSKRLASQIFQLGYSNVFVYLGGFKEWSAADLPIERTSNDE